MSATESAVLSISIFGLAVVISLLVAVVIRGIVVLVSRGGPSEPTTEPQAQSTRPDTIQPSEVAAIAAALSAVLGEHRIVHVARAGRDRTWTYEGRSAHHASHNVPVRHRSR